MAKLIQIKGVYFDVWEDGFRVHQGHLISGMINWQPTPANMEVIADLYWQAREDQFNTTRAAIMNSSPKVGRD